MSLSRRIGKLEESAEYMERPTVIVLTSFANLPLQGYRLANDLTVDRGPQETDEMLADRAAELAPWLGSVKVLTEVRSASGLMFTVPINAV
jgi:hypothetical protein